jgi:polyketide cyclase/dehydrase/lipid transport protein
MPAESIEVNAPSEQVWTMVSDVTRIGEWSPEAVAAQWLDGATGPAVGARFRGRNKRRGAWSTTCTVTAADPGRAFAFSVGKGETTWRYDLAPVVGGCRVTESFEIVKVPGPIGRWSTKLGTGVVWADREADLLHGVHETLRRLKAAAEA